ncbi:hypothetical protein B4135_1541 [Caldibacillus debilis]|uniref:Uncharacterized protein n=1 Tax=Caldibacillus debilis TaxID=301148 RepID=A0A150MC51_9BACI|nr:hypothetical protein B4135_1541 [Caldibacillus debilis]
MPSAQKNRPRFGGPNIIRDHAGGWDGCRVPALERREKPKHAVHAGNRFRIIRTKAAYGIRT